MAIITIIAYKSNGYTSARGHVMDTWDSDHEFRCFDNIDNNIDKSIQYLGELMDRARSEDGSYDYHILINGKDNHFTSEEEDAAINKIKDGAYKYLQDAIKAENELKEVSRQNEAKRVAEEQNQKKREELEKLKERFSIEGINKNRARMKQLEEELKENQ